ncbi:MAG: phosphoadenosine phosphosulfate reductase family protein [Alistipes sp.]|nr:phosphoadenosine phosphosulfate reductase family protein [Alistipes sp.]
MKMTLEILRERQAWPLEKKIDHTVGAIDAFLAYCREHGRNPYVSFSGGLNSTVLLHLARRVFGQDLKGVFCSTGNEFPEIVRFVRQTSNVDIIHPALTPRQVMEQYGFPLVSKEAAQAVRQIRTTESDKLRNYRLYGDGVRRAGVLATRWSYLVNEPYMTSEKCCEILKKRPFRNYNTETRSLAMVGTLAGESKLRQSQYIRRGGCNVFDGDPRKVHSAPLSIWTGADCWEYIRRYDVSYCEIYDVEGIERTGCVFCGFGAQFNAGRFRVLYNRYPKLYCMAMNYTNNGYTLRHALRSMGVALPDEQRELF